MLTMRSFDAWRSEVLAHVSGGTSSKTAFGELFTLNEHIAEERILPVPLQTRTNEYLNMFCANIIIIICNSTGLERHVVNAYQSIIISFCKLMPQILEMRCDEFMEAAATIVVNQNAPFFQEVGSDSRSQFRETCARTLGLAISDEQLDKYFGGRMTLRGIHTVLSVVSLLRRFLNHSMLIVCAEMSLKFLVMNILDLAGNALRKLDEAKVAKVFDLMLVCCSVSEDLRKDVLKAYVTFSIRLVKSEFLEKQFTGLKTIRRMVTEFNDKETEFVKVMLEKEGMIDCALNDLHYELVSDFGVILKEMLKDGCVTDAQIRRFWDVSVHEHSGTMEHFLNVWQVVGFLLPQRHVRIVADAVLQADCLPEPVLVFISSNVIKFEGVQEEQLFGKLTEIFKQTERQESRKLILRALRAHIPRDSIFEEKLRRECWVMIEKHQDLDYALTLLQDVCGSFGVDSCVKFIEALSQSRGVDISAHLDLITKLLVNSKGPLSDELLDSVVRVTMPLLKEDSVAVVDFFVRLLKSNIMTDTVCVHMFSEICRGRRGGQGVCSILKILFARINAHAVSLDVYRGQGPAKNVNILRGIDDLWSLVFSSGDTCVVQYVVSIYTNSADPNAYFTFIERCISFINCVGAIKAVNMLIKDVECGIDKELIGMTVNKVMTCDDYITVRLCGDVNREIRVPQNLDIAAVTGRVAQILGYAKGGVQLANDEYNAANEVLFDGMCLTVVVNESCHYQSDIIAAALPSVILSADGMERYLLKVLKSNNAEASMGVLEIMEQMPNARREVEKLWDVKSDWSKLLSLFRPYVLIYRLNIIGNLFQEKSERWISHFLEHGASAFFALILNHEMSVCSRVLFKCARVMANEVGLDRSAFDEYRQSCTGSLIWSATAFITKGDSDVASSVLAFLAAFRHDIAVDTMVRKLIKMSLFHRNAAIRDGVECVIISLALDKQMKLLTPLFELASMHDCSQFFRLIVFLARNTDDAVSMWDECIEQLFGHVCVPHDKATDWQRPQQRRSSEFSMRLLEVLFILVGRIKTVTRDREVFVLLIREFLLNHSNYFESTPELWGLIKELMERNPDLETHLIAELTKLGLPDSGIETTTTLSSTAIHKGLRNMGSTCYMNSVLQQLYNVPELRSSILAKCVTMEECDWFVELQSMFAHLMYYPSACVDTAPFTQVWRDWHDEIINPREQQDAAEFCQMLIERLGKHIPDAVRLFQGEIVDHITGVGAESGLTRENVQPFMMFPLPVKDHTCIQESLASFFSPNRFDGDNQYFFEGTGKIDAERCSRVRKAPTVLIVMLKRFEYNLVTKVHEKVNDKYMFDAQLDFSSVMEDASKPVVYELSGMIVHSGSAHGGHYMSDVKMATGWGRFNDERFTGTSSTKIPLSVYGGYYYVSVLNNGTGEYTRTKRPVSGNAYMLFYRKVGEKGEQHSMEDSINEAVVKTIVSDIRRILRWTILSDTRFAALINNIRFDGDSCTFLAEYLKVMVWSLSRQWYRISVSQVIRVIEKCVSVAHDNEKFASLFLCDTSIVIDALITLPKRGLRTAYLHLVSVCSEHVGVDIKKCLITAVTEKLLTDSNEMLVHGKRLSEFFQVFSVLVSDPDVDTETWPAIMMNFLIMLPTVAIDVSPLFDTLTTLVNKGSLHRSFRAQVFDMEFIEKFLHSSENARSFTDFFLSFAPNCEYVQSMIPQSERSTCAETVAGLVIIIMSLDAQAWRFVISVFDKMSAGFVEECLNEIAVRLHQFNGRLNDNLLKLLDCFVSKYMLSSDWVPRGYISDIILASRFPPLKLFELLITKLNDVITFSEGVARNVRGGMILNKSSVFPTDTYFELLERAITEGQMERLFVRDYSVLFMSSLKRLRRFNIQPNYPRNSAVSFLVNTVGVRHSEAFFEAASFDEFVMVMNNLSCTGPSLAKILVSVLLFIPCTKVDVFIKTDVFGTCARVLFVDPTLGKSVKEFLLRRTHPGNVDDICARLWDPSCVDHNISNSCCQFFALSWSILNRFPVASDIFWKNNIIEACMRVVRNDQASATRRCGPAAAKLLAAFNVAFTRHNHGKQSFFFGSPITKLVTYYQNLDISGLFHRASTVSGNDDAVDKNGYFMFITSLLRLQTHMTKTIIVLVAQEAAGYVWALPKSAHRRASDMVALACDLSVEQGGSNVRIFDLLMRESMQLARRDSHESVQSLFSVVERLVNDRTANRIADVISQLVHVTHSPKVFTSSIGRLMIKMASRGLGDLQNWHRKAVFILVSLTSHSNIAVLRVDGVSLLSFLDQLGCAAKLVFNKTPISGVALHQIQQIATPEEMQRIFQ